MKYKLKLQQKILFLVLGISFIIYVIVLSYISLSAKQRAIEDAKEIVEINSENYARRIEKQLDSDMEIVETLSEALLSYQIMPEEQWKQVFKYMYEQVFKNNPQFYALWDSWELSHIDTSWKKPYGRYSYEFYWENNTIKQGSELMSLEGDPEMYARLKKINRQVIEEPYLYSFTGNKEDEVLMTSLIEPLQS